MSDNRPISSLYDLADRTYTDGEPIFASVEEEKRNDLEQRIANLNDALADLETRWAAVVSARDNRVQGKTTYRTDTYRLELDPDGLATDQAISKIEAGGVTLTGFTSRAGNVAGVFDTLTLPANILRADGKVLRFTCWGTKSAANAAAVLEVQFAGATLTTVQIQASALRWIIHILYIRTGSNTQDWFVEAHNTVDDDGGFNGGGVQALGSTRLDFGTDAETDTAAITHSIRNDGTGNASDTLVQEGRIVEILN